jgi:uncharacterized membrane protein
MEEINMIFKEKYQIIIKEKRSTMHLITGFTANMIFKSIFNIICFIVIAILIMYILSAPFRRDKEMKRNNLEKSDYLQSHMIGTSKNALIMMVVIVIILTFFNLVV